MKAGREPLLYVLPPFTFMASCKCVYVELLYATEPFWVLGAIVLLSIGTARPSVVYVGTTTTIAAMPFWVIISYCFIELVVAVKV